MKYYTSKHEIVFMYVFLNDRELLKDLLETILEKRIKNMIILNPNLVTDRINNRIQKLDLLIKTDDEYINVELNSKFDNLIFIRNLYYAFKLCSSKAEKGKTVFNSRKKVIQINLNFNCRGYKKDELGLYSKQKKLIVTDILTIININIDFYVEDYYNNGKKFRNSEELIIMLGLEKDELTKLAKRSDKVMKYKKLVDEVNQDDEVISWFTAEEERKMYQDALIEQSKEAGIIEGKKAGVIEGKKAGIIEGEKKGVLNVAKKMLEENISIDLIAKFTNLTEKQISRLL